MNQQVVVLQHEPCRLFTCTKDLNEVFVEYRLQLLPQQLHRQ